MTKHAVIYQRKSVNLNLQTRSMKVGAVTPKPHTSYTSGRSVGRQGDSAWLQKNKNQLQ